MRTINNILVFFISLVFIFSTTGLFLIHHECKKCDITEIIINKEKVNKEDHKCKQTCCPKSTCEIVNTCQNIETNECCNDEVFYLKITEPFLFYTFSVDLNERAIQLFDTKIIELLDTKLTNQISYTSINKPPDLSGRDILRNCCILRV